MSLLDELVENERVASDPLVFVIFDLEIDRFLHWAKTRDSEVENDENQRSDAARSFSMSSSRSDILSLSET